MRLRPFLDHEWKHAFFVRCLSPVLEAMVVADAPNYSRILELDNIVRDFAVPAMLDGKYAHDANPRFLVMQRGLVSSSREIGTCFITFHLSDCNLLL